ncbi:MAG: M48 family metalloprotease [Pseudomonadales bacterium]
MIRVEHQAVSGRPRAARRAFAVLATMTLLVTARFGMAAPADDLPSLGDGSSSIVSPAMEKRIGREFLKQINAMVPTIDDPILKYYADRSVADLVQYSQLNEKILEVVLIDSPEVNAFAAPGGVVGINLGLFLVAEDVHEYSSVIAHELAHLSQRHFARGIEEQRQAMLPTMASMIAAIAIGMAAGGDAGIAAMSASQAAAQSNALRYSRSRETEADRIGMNTLVNAGLDPDGMARMFDHMGRAYRYSTKPPEFLLTHPLSERRVADAKTQAMQYPDRKYQDSPDYALVRTRAIVHYADSPEEAVKRFRKEVKDDPDSPTAQYGLALALSRAGHNDEAVPMADALFSSAPDRLLFVAAYAEFLTAAGEYDQALTLLERQLLLNPDNAPLAMLYADALMKNEEFDIAETVLKRQSELRPNDVDVWYELAEVSGKAGDIVGVHRARAEYFALHGAYNRAIQHLEYARRLVGQDDTKLLAMLDQRINDLRTELRIAQS